MNVSRVAATLLLMVSLSAGAAPSEGIQVRASALRPASAPMNLPGITRVQLPVRTSAESEAAIQAHVLPANPNAASAAQAKDETKAQPLGPASIVELTRALRNDVDLIYEYVRNNIEYYPVWGVQKGALGAILDNAGTGFDQAALMVALLRQAGYTATFVKGGIDLNATQVQSWLGVSTTNACAVGSLLANGGIPVTGLFSTSGGCTALTHVRLDHVWVKVIIGGTAYVFDPSFKSHTLKGGINLTTATGYNATTYFNQAKIGASQTADYVQNINRTNIRNNLATYANNLATYVRTNLPAGTLDDLVGGMTITPVSATPPLRQTSLPYQDGAAPAPIDLLETACGPCPTNNVNAYKPTLRVRYAGIDQTFTSDAIYGTRLTITYDGTNHALLLKDGATVATGSVVSAGSVGAVTFDIVHNAYPGFVDQSFQQSITGGGMYIVGNGWGPSGRGPIEFHRARLVDAHAAGLPDTAEVALGSTLAVLSSTWIAQTNRMYYLHDRIGRTTTTLHHQVGIAGYSGTSYVDLPGNFVSIASQDDDANKESAVFFSSAMHASIFESVTVQQISSISAVSTVKLIDAAVQSGNRVYDATSSSQYASQVDPNLVSCSAFQKANFAAIVNAGYRLVLPDHCSLGENSWSGTGYYQIFQSGGSSSIGAIINGGLSGGFATLLQSVLDFGRNGQDNSEGPLLAYQNTGRGLGEPIDMSHGHFLGTHADIKTGAMEFPDGFELSRMYSSGRRGQAGPFGNGWTHNFAMSASVNSDGLQAMGDDSALDAVATVLETFVAIDQLTDATKPLDKLVIATLGQRWYGDQLINNIVWVHQGVNAQAFVNLPDGSYNAPPGNSSKLIRNVDGTFTLENVHKGRYNFDNTGKVATYDHPNGVQVKFSYSGNDLVQVQNSFGFTLDLTNSGGRITRVADGARHVDYAYSAGGNLLSFSNATGDTSTYQYDSLNRLLKTFYPANPAIATVINGYDSLSRVQTQTMPNGRVYNFYFAGSRSEQESPDGSRSVYYIDEMGNVLKQIDPSGQTTVYTYDGQSRLVNTIFPEGNSIAQTYDDAPCAAQLRCTHNLKTMTASAKPGSGLGTRTVSFTYETAFNQVASVTDALGNATDFTYTAKGDPLVLLQPPDSVGVRPQMTFTYSTFTPAGYPSFDLPTKVSKLIATGDAVDEAITYNAANRYLPQTRTTDAGAGKLNLTTSYDYSPSGDIIQIDGPRSDVTDVTTYSYDAERRLVQVTDALGKQTRYGYDADGQLVRRAGQLGAQWMVTCQTFDASASPVKTLGPAVTAADTTCPATTAPNAVKDYAYDDLNRLVRETVNLPAGEGGNRVSQIVYDLNGRVTAVQRALGTALAQTETTFTYTANGQLATVTDAKGNRTTYTYDGFDRPSQTNFPDPVTANTSSVTDFEQYAYDAGDNLVTRRTRSGQSITVSYDKLHRLTARSYPNAADNMAVSYDLMGRMVSASYVDGSYAVTYAWDHASRLLSTTAGGRTVSYQYDAAGNRVRTTWPEATPFFVTTTFDALNRPSSMLELGTTTLVSYTYDDLSRRTAVTPGNGTSTSLSFSPQGTLASLAHDLAGTAGDVSFGYSHNQARQLTAVDASNPVYQWRGYSNGTRAYVSNGLNQYTSVGGSPASYDANGNLAADGVWSYAYDAHNRMRVATGNGTSATLAWDAPGRLRQTTINGATTNLLYDGARLIAEYDGAGNLLRRFVHGAGLDRPLVRYEGSDTNNKSWLYADRLGNVVADADATGNLRTAFSYGPFGEPGATGAGRFGFTGQQYIAGLNLYDFRSRFYSPTLGRFLQPDPLGWIAGVNEYAYVANDPANTVDPDGLVGVGWQVTGGGDAGVRDLGGGFSIQGGGGGFYDWNGKNGFSAGGFRSDGFMLRAPGKGNSLTSTTPRKGKEDAVSATGLSAGIVTGPFITNADTVDDLSGPADTWNLNIGWGIDVSISLSISWGPTGPTWILSGGVGWGWGASLSHYPTNTIAAGTNEKPKPKPPARRGGGYSASAV